MKNAVDFAVVPLINARSWLKKCENLKCTILLSYFTKNV